MYIGYNGVTVFDNKLQNFINLTLALKCSFNPGENFLMQFSYFLRTEEYVM